MPNKKVVIFAGNHCNKEKEDHYFGIAYETGKRLAQAGFTTITGGGPGLMNEALRGAYEHDGDTVGINLSRPGRTYSKFIKSSLMFEKLGPRQQHLIEIGDAYIALPGGIGTLYEAIAILALKKVDEIPLDKPLILIGDYYKPLKNLFVEMIGEGFVNEFLHELFTLIGTPKEAVMLLKQKLG